MKRFNVVTLRQTLAAVLNRVERRGERILIQRRGQDAAALIPIEDLKLLEKLIAEEEDRIDIAAVHAALAEPGAPMPYEEFRKTLGLDDGATKKEAARREQAIRSVESPARARAASKPRNKAV